MAKHHDHSTTHSHYRPRIHPFHNVCIPVEMIIRKEEPELQEDPQLLDQPPSYDQINPGHSSVNPDFRPDVKAGPSSSPSTPTPAAIAGPPLQQSKQKPRTTWLDSFRLSQQAKDVRATVRSIVRDVVKEPKTPASLGLLESCADACSSNNLSFSEILQDSSIEGHPAIYWAIVKRPSPNDFELITSLMSYSAPLTMETMTEVRLACLHVGDQALFQCLWRSPEYGALSGADRMLLGVSSPPDTIDVEEQPGQDGPFVVRLTIVQFEKRMKVSGEIAFEFIARGTSLPHIGLSSSSHPRYHVFHTFGLVFFFSPLGRIWKLKFHVTKNDLTHQPGPWAVMIQTLEQSPPTHLDARVVIKEPEKESPGPPLVTPPSRGLASFLTSPSPQKSTPPIELRLKTGMELTPVKAGRKPDYSQKVQALFADSAQGNSLQYP